MSDQAANALERESIKLVDTANLIDDILAMPDHIEDALWRAESAMLPNAEAQALIVCGMGGSAVGSDLAAAALGPRLNKPLHVVRGYDLPSWVTSECAVLISSYSGGTEETLSCYEQATARGCKIFVTSSGGKISELAHAAGQPVIGLPGIFQPRAAVAYGVVATVEIAIAAGIVDANVRSELSAAAASLREAVASWGPDAGDDALPKRLAREAYGRLAVIYGAGLTAPIAYRWRCQINENAKVPAADYTLPEANHNEICGWEGAGEVVEQTAWFLRDRDQNERERRRIELTAEIASAHGAKAEVIDTIGETRCDRLFASIMLGDLMSLCLAVLRGVDPSPVPVIEGLKDSLGRPAES